MSKAKTKKRDRSGYVMVHLDDRTRAQLEAVRAYWEHETEEKVNKSVVVRAAIRQAYADLPQSFQIPDPES